MAKHLQLKQTNVREGERCHHTHTHTPYHRTPTTGHIHTQHTMQEAHRGESMCPLSGGLMSPPGSFSPDNSCIDNTYQLGRYKRRGRRQRKGTKSSGRKGASQPVNGYPFTSVTHRTIFLTKKTEVLTESGFFLTFKSDNKKINRKKTGGTNIWIALHRFSARRSFNQSASRGRLRSGINFTRE